MSSYCVLYDSLYVETKGENGLFIYSTSCVFSMFSYTFEKQFKTLIGQKFNTEFLSSFYHMGVTEAAFAFSGNSSFFILLLIDCERGLAK